MTGWMTMELLDALLQNTPAAAEGPLRALGVRQWGAAFENLRRMLLSGPPREFEPLFQILQENLPRNSDADRALNNIERFFPFASGPIHPIILARDRPYLCNLLLDLFGFSQFISDILIRYPHYVAWLGLPGTLEDDLPPDKLEADLAAAISASGDTSLRQIGAIRWARQRLVALGARVVLGLLDEIAFMQRLSELAVALIKLAVAAAAKELEPRFGIPMEEGEDGNPSRRQARFAVIGMGKLGGMELNFSSDIDLMFIYSSEGWTTGIKSAGSSVVQGRITNHDYFNRLAERISSFLSAVTPEGYLYRVDTRLRPDGEEGPLARSLPAFEIYHETQARPWERMALIKGKAVAGDPKFCAEFDRVSRALVFDRSIGGDVIRHVRELKWKIDAEVESGADAGREIKRGEGGIREIEFLVQTLQLIHGPARADLRGRATLDAIDALSLRGLIEAAEAGQMREDYLFLRRVEHRLQMMDLRQTHTIPKSAEEVESLARRCGLTAERGKSAGEILLARWNEVRSRVHAKFTDFFGWFDGGATGEEAGGGEGRSPAQHAARALIADAPEKDLIPLLAPFGIESPGAIQTLKRLGGMGKTIYLTEHGRELFASICPDLIQYAAASARPETALAHLESCLQSSGSYAALYEIFRSNPRVLGLLLKAFGAANSWAQTLAANPEFFDYLLDPGFLAAQPARGEIEQRLKRWMSRGRGSISQFDFEAYDISEEDFSEALARLRRFEYLMTGLAETAGLIDYDQAVRRLTLVAEIIVHAATLGGAAAARIPRMDQGSAYGFSVLAMGKLGARELNYFSDLDLIFCWDDRRPGRSGDEAAQWDARAIAAAGWIVGTLTRASAEGIAYQVDARLRPEGQNAPLAPAFSRYLEYYKSRAELWEMQSLMKVRCVAGDARVGQQLIAQLIEIIRRRLASADWGRGVLDPMRAMRKRIEQSAKTPSWVLCDFKKGYGGLADLEFIAQQFQLGAIVGKYKEQEGASYVGLRADEVFRRMAAIGVLSVAESAALAEDYLFLRRLESRARLLFETDKSQLPSGGEKWDALRRSATDLLPEGVSPRELRDYILATLQRNRRHFEHWIA